MAWASKHPNKACLHLCFGHFSTFFKLFFISVLFCQACITLPVVLDCWTTLVVSWRVKDDGK